MDKITDSGTIQGSRWPYLANFMLVTGFVAYSGFSWAHTPNARLFVPVTFAVLLLPVLVVLAKLTLSPPIISLEPSGITLPRGVLQPAKSIAWNDIQNFAIYKTGRNGLVQAIAYYLAPGTEASFSLCDPSTWFVQKRIPLFLTMEGHGVVDQLNDYRRRALGHCAERYRALSS